MTKLLLDLNTITIQDILALKIDSATNAQGQPDANTLETAFNYAEGESLLNPQGKDSSMEETYQKAAQHVLDSLKELANAQQMMETIKQTPVSRSSVFILECLPTTVVEYKVDRRHFLLELKCHTQLVLKDLPDRFDQHGQPTLDYAGLSLVIKNWNRFAITFQSMIIWVKDNRVITAVTGMYLTTIPSSHDVVELFFKMDKGVIVGEYITSHSSAVPFDPPYSKVPEEVIPDPIIETKPTCNCKRTDAWKCAVEQRLSSVSCHCACHRRQL